MPRATSCDSASADMGTRMISRAMRVLHRREIIAISLQCLCTADWERSGFRRIGLRSGRLILWPRRLRVANPPPWTWHRVSLPPRRQLVSDGFHRFRRVAVQMLIEKLRDADVRLRIAHAMPGPFDQHVLDRHARLLQ